MHILCNDDAHPHMRSLEANAWRLMYIFEGLLVRKHLAVIDAQQLTKRWSAVIHSSAMEELIALTLGIPINASMSCRWLA